MKTVGAADNRGDRVYVKGGLYTPALESQALLPPKKFEKFLR
jgi:hypothetical protein